MSYARKQTTKSQTSKKQHCSVCYDAKKPESVYSTHWVKDTTGRVCCPTLLSQECRFCHKKGHTVKHCAVLKEENSNQKKIIKNKNVQPQVYTKKEKENKNSSMYSVLCESDEEDNTQKQTTSALLSGVLIIKISTNEEYPALSSCYIKIKSKQEEKGNNEESYASKLLKEPEVKKRESDEIKITMRTMTYSKMTTVPKQCESPKNLPVAMPSFNMKIKKYTSWADASSSDEGEDEYDDNYEEY